MTGTIHVDVPNASCFIVPNNPGRVREFMNAETRKEFLTELARLNGWGEITDETALVQLWFHDKEVLKTDNLVDHGGSVKYNGERCHVYIDSTFSFLPISIFDGKVEGDKIHIDLPTELMYRHDVDAEYDKIPVILHMDVSLKQLGYRYSNYGKFDQLMELVKSKLR